MSIDKRVISILEYDKIVQMLSEQAKCCVGKELALALEPINGLDRVSAELELTAEAEAYIYRYGSSPTDDIPDVRECLKRIHAALAISPAELLAIMRCMRVLRLTKERIMADESLKRVANLAQNIGTHRSVEEEINRCIISEEEIFDGASPLLARIRQKMRQANERVREKLNSMIKSSSYQKYLQEPIVTMRNGRYVLPVRQEYRQQVPGLIHDQSGSGATLFIEPTAVVELGNEVKKLAAEENEEVERILAELTAMVEPYADEMLNDISTLGELDLVFAKAALSRCMNGVQPKLNDKGVITIIQGRHPLIGADKVVPIDIWLGKDYRTLIVTGPNTGGKTVTLKTVGLFTLMAQSGLFVPAAFGTELSVFEDVFADIGDEQSIEQSLSTFSSHMTTIVDILGKADCFSLVLLDELGAGTDPIEGAALAMSILQELHSRSCVTLATTHYSEIKAFALTHDGMENASMEFNVDKLCPTYRLFIGIPGKSNAFEISKRLGLSEYIIESARKFLKNEDVSFEDVISNAESQRRIAEQEKLLAQQARQELDRLRAETQRERERLDNERAAQKAKAKEEARRMIADARHEIDSIVSSLKSAKAINRSDADRAIQKSRDALRRMEGALTDSEPDQNAAPDGEPVKSVKPGDTVKVVSLGQKATVLSAPDARGEVQVQAGIMKVMVKLKDLRTASAETKQTKGARTSQLMNAAVPLELDLRGMLVDDALIEIDRYLDTASMCGRTEVNIIHGKGTGALRTGVQEYLKHNPRVKTFRLGNYGEGDAGVTVVTLKG